jgi:hypothetical protein
MRIWRILVCMDCGAAIHHNFVHVSSAWTGIVAIAYGNGDDITLCLDDLL